MIILSLNDSIQVANSTTDWSVGWDTILKVIGVIVPSIAAFLTYRKWIKDNRIRKLSIQPRFEIINTNESHNEPLNYLVFELTNKRGDAKNITLTDIDGSTAISEFSVRPLKYLQFLGTNESATLIFTPEENPATVVNVIAGCYLHTKISFVDVQNNSYTQIIKGKVSSFNFFEPLKLSEPFANTQID